MSSTPAGSLVPNLSSEVSSSISGTSSIVSTPSVSSLVGEGGASDGNQNGTAEGGGSGGGGPPVIQDSTTILLIVLFVFLAFFVYLVTCGYSSRRTRSFFRRARGDEVRYWLKWKKPLIWDVWVSDTGYVSDEKRLGDNDLPMMNKWEDIRKPLSVTQVRGKARLEKLASEVNPSSAMYFIRTRRTPAIEDIDPIFSLDQNNHHTGIRYQTRAPSLARARGSGRTPAVRPYQTQVNKESSLTSHEGNTKTSELSSNDNGNKEALDLKRKRKRLQVTVLIAMPNPSKPMFVHKQQDDALSGKLIEELSRGDIGNRTKADNNKSGICVNDSEIDIIDIGIARVPIDSRDLEGIIQRSRN